ncbi:MAG: molybdopterin-dependent oxidoreductase [Smithella sp.]
MAVANITINGRKISTQAGITILQAAREAGIDIPTLCDHPALSPVGACRMCIVEVTGQRTLQTACTFPVSEGMQIETDSPQTVKARKLVLDMLFSERNHFCPYCEMSGDCELQSLGYRYGVDHWVFPTYTKSFDLDASHKYYLMENNRCILCGRCYRACDELAANHTLGLRQRGNESMIHADANIPRGESTCISCGTCVQVCPTGALSDKRSAFMGRESQTQKIKSTCSQCSIGCGIEIVMRGGNILRLNGDWEAPVNKGLLCVHGRYEPLYDVRQRISKPLIRTEGMLAETTWEQAIQTLTEKISAANKDETGLLVSSHATNEALYLINTLFREKLQVNNISLLNKAAPEIPGKRKGSLADINNSDVIILIGADPVSDQPVASFIVKRAYDRGARLVVIDEKENGLSPFAFMNLGYDGIDTAIDLASRAEHPVVLYGSEITRNAVEALQRMDNKAVFIALEPGVNTSAAAALKFDNGFSPSSVKCLYVLAGEQDYGSADLLKDIARDAFVVVQAGYMSHLIERADLVLPSAIWSERSGSLTNMEGLVQEVNKAVEPIGEAKTDCEALSLLAEKLGKKIDVSHDEISSYITRLVNERRS